MYRILIILFMFTQSCKQSLFEKELKKLSATELKASKEVFQEDSAYLHIEKQVAFGPRVPNLASHKNTAKYLISKFKNFKLQTLEQNFEILNYQGDTLELTNIIAQYKPKLKNRLLLMTHWDTRPFADNESNQPDQKKYPDGANDGASGVAIFLEIARLLELENPKIGIDIILFDGEESGPPLYDKTFEQDIDFYCLGSQYFCKNNLLNTKPLTGILLDIVGGKNAEFHIENISKKYAYANISKFYALGNYLNYNNTFIPESQYFVGADDHLYINKCLQVPSFAIIEYDKERNSFNKHQHKLSDTLENIDKKTLKAIGQTLWIYILNYEKIEQL